MLRINGICKVFNPDTVDEKLALQQINLSLKKGDFVTIIGSNGAGKSTLMNMISGVHSPDRGTIEIDGKVVNHLPEYRRASYIGRVFQDPMAGTAPGMTIEENLAIAYARDKGRGLGMGVTRSRRKLFQSYLASLHLGLEDRLKAKVGLLSGGERQALSLLMATFTEPRVLLLDEHTAALDPSRARRVTELTQEIVEKQHLTTLMVTHNMQQALDLGNRLIMMDRGKIIFEASGEEKKQLTVEGLLEQFRKLRGEEFSSDRAVLG